MVKFWLDSAAEDLTVCDSLFEKKHYAWCLFIAHLVLEKTLKAMWYKNHYPEPHPWIHNLEKLAKQTSVQLTEEQRAFLVKVNDFYLTGRYPEEKIEFHKICTRKFARENLNAIKDFYKWLLKQF